MNKIHWSILWYLSPVLCVLYKSVRFIEFLMKFCINDKIFLTILIKTKELLHYKVFKLGKNVHVDKTCFLRPGHYIQWKLLFRTLENKNTRIIHIFSCGPKWCFFIQIDLENQDTLITWELLVGPKVSIIHRFHCTDILRSSNNVIIKLLIDISNLIMLSPIHLYVYVYHWVGIQKI